MGNSKYQLVTLLSPRIAPAIVVAGALLLGTTPALAQEMSAEVGGESTASSPNKPIQVGAFLGGNYLSPNNELGNSTFDNQVPGSGFLLGLRANYLVLDSLAPDMDMNPQLRVEAESKYTFSSTDGGMGRDSITTPILGWRANILLDLFPQNKLTPFALVGIGGETVFGSNLFMTSPDTDFAAFLGGGVRYGVADDIEVRADLRLGETASREGTASALFEVHLGVAYNFGFGEKVEEVLVPIEKPVIEERKDRDKDGILDDKDKCPDLAEVYNDIDDEDGCPEVDSDNDGLLGSQDKCPAAAEDVDGHEDDDGCPDPDNDGDGRPDFMDQCPARPENLNGYEDEDGCPDTIPEKVKEFTGSIKGIRFRTGSARILRTSRATLNAAYKVFMENPSIRIEISGHTDNKGKDENNRALARKRADYVKWYLVDKGIDADRILTVGHGPDKPIASNDTKSGRRENRRIEFKLLPGTATVAPIPIPTP
jgi:OOP family OmpA-OmpF porin